jgi:hypothetical protein
MALLQSLYPGADRNGRISGDGCVNDTKLLCLPHAKCVPLFNFKIFFAVLIFSVQWFPGSIVYPVP